ncbi:mortality factor 4-like protein 1 [Macrotis lagotis]|uniref:mortality factor 4-like protein 1 n=1 Tax=Macrotis lagotis TaxID=92651 RepID=UPI003D6975DA
MAHSKQLAKLVKDSLAVEEGEPVLVFQGPKLRRGQCMQVAVRDKQVKYLVRYARGRGNSEALTGAEAPSSPQPEPGPSPSLATPSSPDNSTSIIGSRSSGSSPSNRHRPLSSLISNSNSNTAGYHGDGGRGDGGADVGGGGSGGDGYEYGDIGCSSSSSQQITVPLWTPTEGNSQKGPSTSELDPPSFTANVNVKKDLLSIVVVGDWEHEWVPEGRVLRYSATQVQDSDATLQMAAKREQLEDCPVTSSGGTDEGGIGKGRSTWCGTMMQWPRKRKRGRRGKCGRPGWDPTADHTIEYMSRKEEVQVQLPKTLKPLLVEDWELVTLRRKLFTLPAKKTVASILAEYAASQQNYGTATKKLTISELMASLQEYFDKVLGDQLLYNFEKPQHLEIMASHPSTPMSQIYGGAHLLRLFSQMGSMLACTPLNDSSLNVLQSHLQDFLQYLAYNPSRLFSAPTDYQEASADYQQKAG